MISYFAAIDYGWLSKSFGGISELDLNNLSEAFVLLILKNTFQEIIGCLHCCDFSLCSCCFSACSHT